MAQLLHTATWQLDGVLDGTFRLAVYTPFSRAFVERLKYEIPARERAWFPLLKIWLFDLKHEEYVRQMLRDYHHEMPCDVCWVARRTCVTWKRIDEQAQTLRGMGWLSLKDRRGQVPPARKTAAPPPAPPPRHVPPRVRAPRRPLPRTNAEALAALGLVRGASVDDIKRASRRLALVAHPDKTSGNNERMVQINAARDILLGKRRAAR
jgi:hypothetical protein